MTVAVIGIYVLSVLAVAVFSRLHYQKTGEEYFVASRRIGPFVLLMSLFGTQMTAFALLGASAQSYSEGIGVFALMASTSALIVPIIFLFIGTRVWSLGKRFGYLTPVQYFRDRWQCGWLGLALFALLVALLVPYILIGVMGGGIAVYQVSDGQVPEWVGSLALCAIVSLYVAYGGMRATAWVNTLQTLVFLSLSALAFLWITYQIGGVEEAMRRVEEIRPDLLIRGEHVKPLKLISYIFIPASSGMFPHLFSHWLTARRASAFRFTVVSYPICIAVLWTSSVLIGLFGVADFPGLQGSEANSILVRMIRFHSPELLAGLLGAGVVAAIMSSLDSQVLSLSTMFTQDIVRHYGFHNQLSDRSQILLARLFVLLLLGLAFALSMVSNPSIFSLGVWCFSGFSALLPILLAALFWKRSTRWGALASAVTVSLLWIYFFSRGGQDPDYSLGGTGLMPVVVLFGASAVAMVLVSWLTPAPKAELVSRFFPTPPSLDSGDRS